MSEFATYQDWLAAAGEPWTTIHAYIQKDMGDAPCCHWGTKTWDTFAVLYCGILWLEGGSEPCDPALDGDIGRVVNDSDGMCATTVVRYRHVLPDGWQEFMDVEDFASATRDETVAKIVDTAIEVGRRCTKAIEPLDPRGLRYGLIYNEAWAVAWAAVFEHYDNED